MKNRILLIPALMTLLLSSVAFTSQEADALSCGIAPFTQSFERHDLLLHGILIEKLLIELKLVIQGTFL